MSMWNIRQDPNLQREQDYEFFKMANPIYLEEKKKRQDEIDRLVSEKDQEPPFVDEKLSELGISPRDVARAGLYTSNPTPEELAIAKEHRDSFIEVINRLGVLDETDRKILLGLLEGKEYSEISEELKIPLNTLSGKATRAKERLLNSELYKTWRKNL